MDNDKLANEKRADELMAAITLYTNQLEDYDKSNFNACMTCIGFIGGLIAAVGAILCTSLDAVSSNLLNETISIIILLIPAIITLFLYQFAMSCRRSALFRGYVQFLEKQLNEMTGSYDMFFSSYLIPEYYAKFAVNHFGPAALIIFLILIFTVSFVISIIFALKSSIHVFVVAYRIVVLLFAIFSIGFDVMYIRSLVENKKVIEETMKKSEEKYKSELPVK